MPDTVGASRDGGWGWIIVFTSFMVTLIADGISLSFGILYVELELHFKGSKSLTSLMGSLLLSIPELVGPIASALTDRYGCRTMTIISGLISAAGFMIGSQAQKLEHLLIAFSITGIGLSASYVTSVVIVAYYFHRKRSLATGLASCGSGVGTFIFAPLTAFLLKEYSWRGTLLIMSGFFLSMCLFGLLMSPIEIIPEDKTASRQLSHDLSSESSISNPVSETVAANEESTNNEETKFLESHMHSENATNLIFPMRPHSTSDTLHVISTSKVPLTNRGNFSLIDIPTYLRSFSFIPMLSLQKKKFVSISSPALDSDKEHDSKGCTSGKDLDLPRTEVSKPHNSTPIIGPPIMTRSKDWISPPNGQICHPRMAAIDFFGHRSFYLRQGFTYRTAVFKSLVTTNSQLQGTDSHQMRQNQILSSMSEVNIDVLESTRFKYFKLHKARFMRSIKRFFRDSVFFSSFKNVRFTLFCLSNLLLHGCFDAVYIYLPNFAKFSGHNENVGSHLISAIGVANTLGTAAIGYIGDKPWLHPSTWYGLLTILGGISMALVPLARHSIALGALSACYGISISANSTLVSIILVEIISLEKLANAYGLLLMVQGIASIGGPPFAGWLFDISGSFDLTFYFIGIVIFLSGLIVFPIRKSQEPRSNPEITVSLNPPTGSMENKN